MTIEYLLGSPRQGEEGAAPKTTPPTIRHVSRPAPEPVGANDVAPSEAGTEAEKLLKLWSELTPLRLDAPLMEKHRIVTAARGDERHIPFDVLRTKLMKKMRENGWSTLAVTSPTAGCGKTTLSLNLAFSLARQSDFRLALLDFDLRRPGIARLLGCDNTFAIEQFLSGKRGLAQTFLRHGKNLAIAPNSMPVSGAAELLQDQVGGTAIPEMRRTLGLDLMIFDLPPMLATDDVLAILPAVDCVLLVAAAEQSNLNEIDVCERDLADQNKLLGLVLNKCRYVPEKYGY